VIHLGFAKEAGAISRAVKAHGISSPPAQKAIDAFARRGWKRQLTAGKPLDIGSTSRRLAKGIQRGRALTKQALEVGGLPAAASTGDDTYVGSESSGPTRVLGHRGRRSAKRTRGRVGPRQVVTSREPLGGTLGAVDEKWRSGGEAVA